MDKIKEYLEVFGLDTTDEKVDFIIEDIVQRALNYMRRVEVPEELERVIALAIIKTHKKIEAEEDGQSQKISSVSDSGQSVSYSDKAVSYMSSTSDEEILEGIVSQLKMFRLSNPLVLEAEDESA